MPLLAEAGARQGPLVLDFSAVDYISSVGLRVLMIAARQMRTAQARLSVAALQSVVAEIFSISRFDKVLTVSPSLEAALAQSSEAALAAYRAAGGPRTP
jgi:anti-sigma B factor antagonist/stage II sporulation protein AA (anti-sigma F factor antagonist)